MALTMGRSTIIVDRQSPAEETSPQAVEWLTAEQAALYAGRLGIWTVRDACNRKELRHVRVGGRPRGPIRTKREWIDEWLESWTRGGEIA